MKHLHLVYQNGNDAFSWGTLGCEDLGMNHHLHVHLTGTRHSRFRPSLSLVVDVPMAIGLGNTILCHWDRIKLGKKLPKFNLFCLFHHFHFLPQFSNFSTIQSNAFVCVDFLLLFFSIFKHKIWFFVLIHAMWKKNDAFSWFVIGKTKTRNLW